MVLISVKCRSFDFTSDSVPLVAGRAVYSFVASTLQFLKSETESVVL